MRYEKFKCLDKETSLLGFGVMRLPVDKDGQVDEAYGIDLIRYAIDHGINYIDTGFDYHDGRSEVIIGKALTEGYREKAYLADKLPIWLAEKEDDLESLFQEQRHRLGFTKSDEGCFDMYLIHSMDKDNWQKTRDLHVLEFLEEKKAEGRIGHIGFSFHDKVEVFKEVIDGYDWDFCQIQLNYLDKDIQAGLEGLEYARQKGIDVIIMEPLKGGRITKKIPEGINRMWDDAKAEGIIEEDTTPARTAFRWVGAQPGVKLILSGMGDREMIDENIDIFSAEDFGSLTEVEEKLIDRVADEYNRIFTYQCTGCEYCMPCPKGVGIPGVINLLNYWYALDKDESVKSEYLSWLEPEEKANNCVACGKCETICPQSLPIARIMEESVREFGE